MLITPKQKKDSYFTFFLGGEYHTIPTWQPSKQSTRKTCTYHWLGKYYNNVTLTVSSINSCPGWLWLIFHLKTPDFVDSIVESVIAAGGVSLWVTYVCWDTQ